MGVEWGDAADRHQALPGHADAAQPARHRGRGREPHRRHPAVQPGGARRPAPADPSGGERRGRGARRRLLVARGARRGDRRQRRSAPRVSTVVVGGGTRARVPRPQPGAPRGARGVDPRLAGAPARRRRTSAPSCAGCRCSSTRPAGRASARRWRTSRDHLRAAVGRPMSAVRVEAPGAPAPRACSRSPATARGASAGSGCRSAARRSSSRREPADELSAEGADAERALAFARRCHEALGLAGGAHLRVVEAIPPHVGLGSGTKLALAVAQALAALDGRDGRRAGARRGGRARGALRGGHVDVRARRPRGRGRACGRGVERPAPLLARHPMPEEWRVVLVVPRAEPGLSGAAEEEAFRQLVPSPERSAEIAQLVLTSLLPALVERDLEEFGGALTRIQQLVGDAFAAVQGGRFHPRAGRARRGAAARTGRPAPARARGGRRSTASSAARRPDARSRSAWRTSSATRGAWSS